jgi:hypothetical protein
MFWNLTLIKPKFQTLTYGKMRLDEVAAPLWNSLPDNLRLSQSLNSCKKKKKKEKS